MKVTNEEILEMHISETLTPNLRNAILAAMNEFASREILAYAEADESPDELPKDINQWIEAEAKKRYSHWEESDSDYERMKRFISDAQFLLPQLQQQQQTIMGLKNVADNYNKIAEDRYAEIQSLKAENERLIEILKWHRQTSQNKR